MTASPDRPSTFDLNGIHVPKLKRAAQPADGLRQLTVVPFRIVVDSREQLPFTFTGMDAPDGSGLVVPTVVVGLKSGDYSVEGLEDLVAVERKSMDDLFGSVTWGRDRFLREIERLNELPGFACVVIEASWPEIMDPVAHRPGWINQTEPRSVEGTIVSWSIRYPRVHWWPCGDRRGAECRTFSILERFWKEQQKK